MQVHTLKYYPPVRNFKRAVEVAGKLSAPDKMPNRLAWGTPAKHCQRGSRLRKIKGTVCSICYAHKGRIRINEAHYERRFNGINHPQWVDAMVYLIGHAVPIAVPYFRWFDSGDLQSFGHLLKIFQVCERLPQIRFWLPTQEVKLLRRLKQSEIKVPENLVIRLSSVMMEGRPSKEWPLTSSVTRGTGFTCPASLQGNKCLECRLCWDKTVAHVIYHQH